MFRLRAREASQLLQPTDNGTADNANLYETKKDLGGDYTETGRVEPVNWTIS
jgi:hypothetical protein